ncbi:MAG TPA: acyl-CoA thioesterase [Oscillatoriaceae cyanobacterium]
MPESLPGKTPAESRVQMAEFVLPNDTNPHGTIFGGRVMSWIDIAATICASRHCRKPVVTASMDELVFHHPIRLGQVVLLEAVVNEAFTTSMEISVRVFSENPLTGDRRHTTSAYTTFVALDDLGEPARVPPLIATTPEEQQRQQEARARRDGRIARRKLQREEGLH